MKNFLSVVKDILSLLIILAIIFGAGYYMGSSTNKKESIVVENKSDSFDLKLPFEVEKRVVTEEEVEAKLVEIGELSTYSGEYTYKLSKEEERYWLEKIPVLGSTNSIEITCNGIVKVGYNLNDIVVKVDDDTIYIAIPEVQLNDNYVIWDSVVCNETNNILNPINFSQYREIIDEIEEKGLEEVISKGIYQKAEDNLKVLIEAFLAEFTDYTIVYM